MASFLPTSYLPQSIQKRLLRAALSSIGLFDTTSLDLDNLDLKVGIRSVLNFRDLGLDVERLTALLTLPPEFNIESARVDNVQIVLPTDIHRSGIEIDIEGVKARGRIQTKASQAANEQEARKRKAQNAGNEQDLDLLERLPTLVNLEQSFHAGQSEQERRKLVNNVFWKGMDDSVYSDDSNPTPPISRSPTKRFGRTEPSKQEADPTSNEDEGEDSTEEEDEEETGTGTSLALPDFLTNFIKGIGDRINISIKDVQLSLETDTPNMDDSTILDLHIACLDVEGIAALPSLPKITDDIELEREGKRKISVSGLRAYIVANEELFDTPEPIVSPPPEMSESTGTVNPEGGENNSAPVMMEDSVSTIRQGTSPERQRSNISSPESTLDFSVPFHGLPTLNDMPSVDDLPTLDTRPFSPREPFHLDEHTTQEEFDREMQALMSENGTFDDHENHQTVLQEREVQDENGVTYRSATLPASTIRGTVEIPLVFSSSDETSQPTSPAHLPVKDASIPLTESSPPQTSYPESDSDEELPNFGYGDSSDDEQDPMSQSMYFSHADEDGANEEMSSAAQEQLSQSMFFSHAEAESLYMSATSGVAASRNLLQNSTLEEEREEDKLSDREVEARLDRLVGGTNSTKPGEENAREKTPDLRQRRLRKYIFGIDQITVFVPAISDTPPPVSSPAPVSDFSGESTYGSIPGAFSYHVEPLSPKINRQEYSQPESHSKPEKEATKDNKIEVVVSNILFSLDIATAKLIFDLIDSLSFTKSPAKAGPNANPSNSKAASDAVLDLSIKVITCSLVQNLPGIFEGDSIFEDNEPEAEPSILLSAQLQDLHVESRTVQDSLAQLTKICISKIMVNDPHGDPVMAFGQLSPKTARKRPHLKDDLAITINSSKESTDVSLETKRLLVMLRLDRIEELIFALGGFDSVVNLANSVTVGVTKPSSPVKGVRWSDEAAQPIEPEPSTPLNLDAWIGGVKVSIISKDGDARISLKTSVVTINKTDGINIHLDSINAFGPGLEQEGTYATINNTRVEFESAPSDEEDFPRLLRLLTPSKDKFDKDDDILVETLIRQRRQGAVARITSNELKLCVGNREELAKILQVGQEIMRIVTVTNFVAQDERPGILTFLLLQNVDACLDMGEKIGSLEIDAKDLEVAHVSAPMLLATAVRTIDVKRNVDEDLMGEGIPRETMAISERDRPVIMLRLVGDEPEPVIKIKLWNLRMEYHVETIMDATGSPATATTQEMANQMVESIASLAENLGVKRAGTETQEGGDSETPETKIPALNVAIRDSVIALNPLGLPSRGLVVLSEAQLLASTPSPNVITAQFILKKASIVLIDDVSRLQSLRPATSTVGFHDKFLGPDDHVQRFLEMGYVNMITIQAASIDARLADSVVDGGKFIDVVVKDDLLLLETCADSTQTLIELLNGLKPPAEECTEIKYMTEIMPLDVFASITEDQFLHPALDKPSSTSPVSNITTSSRSLQEAIGGNTPSGLTFVESYYDHLEDRPDVDILDDDLEFVARPSSSNSGSMVSSFAEEVQIHGNEPLDLEDSFFPSSSSFTSTINDIRVAGSSPPQFDPSTASPRKPETKKKETVPLASKNNVHKWNSDRRRHYPAGNVDGVSPLRVKVRGVNVIWKMHDGYDWPKTRDTISKAVKNVQTRASEREQQRMRRTSFGQEEEGEQVGDFLFNSIYIAIPPNHDPRSLSQQINHAMDDGMSETGSYASSSMDTRYSNATDTRTSRSSRGRTLRLSRSKKHKLQIELQGVCADFVLFPSDSGETQSSVDIRVRDFEILDNVPTSTWKKFVTYMKDSGPRQTNSDMAHIVLLTVRPIPDLAATEIVIKVSILPLRLHVDQDTLDFLTRFFEFKDTTTPKPATGAEEPFIQTLQVDDVKVKLDYKPKKVDYAGIRSGHTTEFMNFFILDESEMTLRQCTLHGLSGFSKIHKALNDIWMPDIKNNQLAGVVSGVAPVRSLVNIGVGITNLVAVPVREYKKDGRIVRAVQKGAAKFAKTTTTEIVRLGAKVAVGTQNILEGADNMLGGTSSRSREYRDNSGEEESDDDGVRNQISPYADQPKNIGQGLRGAYQSLNKNFGEAREAIMAIPGQAAERGSVQGAAGVVARAGAIAVLRPMVGITEAVGRTLHGAGNSLDKDHLRKVEDKYKRH